jgi:hypothetical protein
LEDRWADVAAGRLDDRLGLSGVRIVNGLRVDGATCVEIEASISIAEHAGDRAYLCGQRAQTVTLQCVQPTKPTRLALT